jgi:hypothetical protein
MKTALYTTLYPNALRFWGDFVSSVEAQNDTDFDLVVCLDMVSADDVVSEKIIPHCYLPSTKTPSAIRQECWQHVLSPDRVKNAKAGLQDSDMDVCGLQLVDVDLKKMDWTLRPDPQEKTKDYIINANDIGLSNTAYHAEFLRTLTPAPDDIIMLDWFLALRAVEEGAQISKRPDLDMLYRQYDGNVANFIPPYTDDMVKTQTARVVAFWESVIPYLGALQIDARERLSDIKQNQYEPRTVMSSSSPKWWEMVE